MRLGGHTPTVAGAQACFRADSSGGRWGSAGFSLIEVMVALLLLSIVLVGTTQAVLDLHLRARRISDHQAEAGARAVSDDAASWPAWAWGAPFVREAVWEADSVLAVRVAVPPAQAPWSVSSGATSDAVPVYLGVWVGGWLAGEILAAGGEVSRLGPGLPGLDGWPDVWDGAELTIRARLDDQGWGAPWRTLAPVPSAAGGAPPAVQDNGIDFVAGVAVHGPFEGHAGYSVRCGTDLGSLVDVDMTGPLPVGGPLFLPLPSEGVTVIGAGSRAQAFRVEPGRWLDVYF